MILHSITPVAAMQQMLAMQDGSAQPVQTMSLGPYCTAQGSIQDGQLVVERILSTDPQDFLNPALFPGARLPFSAGADFH